MEYSADIVVRLARRLYRQADWVVGSRVLLGTIAGLVLCGYFIATHRGYDAGSSEIVAAVIGAVLGGITAQARMVELRAQAQQLLCQVEQEKHLRKLVEQNGRSIDNHGLVRIGMGSVE